MSRVLRIGLTVQFCIAMESLRLRASFSSSVRLDYFRSRSWLNDLVKGSIMRQKNGLRNYPMGKTRAQGRWRRPKDDDWLEA